MLKEEAPTNATGAAVSTNEPVIKHKDKKVAPPVVKRGKLISFKEFMQVKQK